MHGFIVYAVTNGNCKVIDKLGLSYRTPKELNDIIDKELPGRPQFQCQDLTIAGDTLQFYFRDVIQCIRTLYGDPEFAHDLVFAPERHYTDHQRTCRVYSEMHTGDWWWSVQVCSHLSDVSKCLQVMIDIPRSTTTRRHHHPTYCFVRQDTAHTFPWEVCLPSVPYNWQYPQGHPSKANTPRSNVDRLHSNIAS